MKVKFGAAAGLLAALLLSACGGSGEPGSVTADAEVPEAASSDAEGADRVDGSTRDSSTPVVVTVEVPTTAPLPTPVVIPTPAGPAASATSPGADLGATAAPDGDLTASPSLAPSPTVVPASVTTPTVTAPPAPPTPSPVAAVPETARDESSTFEGGVNEVTIANGGEVFGAACSRCHGSAGEGTFIAGSLFGVSGRWSHGGMIDELTNGHAYTFGFADTLSPEEISDVAAYVVSSFRGVG